MDFFIDWLKVYQEFDCKLPLISDRFSIVIDSLTGERVTDKQFPVKYEGSHCSEITISVTGGRITIDGNPSRINRSDNLVGFRTVDECISVYNKILLSYGLPPFTKCTKTFILQGEDGQKARTCSDGAIIQRIDITTNQQVGKGNERAYIKGLATQRYRNSIPFLYPNSFSVDWKSKTGKVTLLYPTVYTKFNDMDLHLLPKMKRKYGIDSPEYKYSLKLRNYCFETGVVRHEQKLNGRFLQKNRLNYWGLSDYTQLNKLQSDFLKLDEKLQVTNMEILTISELLVTKGVCPTLRTANTTANYAILWMAGQHFDLNKSQVKTHRSRLRKIGIDIAEDCDISRHSVVHINRTIEINPQPMNIPDWYQKAEVPALRLVS